MYVYDRRCSYERAPDVGYARLDESDRPHYIIPICNRDIFGCAVPIESVVGNKLKKIDGMKKLFFGVLLMVGFFLMVSESTTFVPNVLGMLLSLFSVDKLDAFEV